MIGKTERKKTMRLTMLGTGNALVTEVYNTCFVIENENQYLLVDGGGGSEILKRLKDAKISIADIHHIFVTHKHIDHILGIVWMTRIICQNMQKGAYLCSGRRRAYSWT